MIEIKDFGRTKNNAQVTEYILRNKNQMEVHLLDFGATIKNIFVPDREGTLADVVLGFDDLASYEKNEVASHGAVVGRVANRIGAGKFTLNGVEYTLDINNNGNCLHGGNIRYEYAIYDATIDEDANAVTFQRMSPDMEQGFPGNMELTVTYCLTEDNVLSLTYTAKSDKDTPINITNHSYFNLKGCETQDLISHEIMIRSSAITETDENLLPNGNYISLEGTPMDLRKLTSVMEYQNADFEPLKYGKGFDHNFVLDHVEGEPDAIAVEKTSGRKMEMYTDLPGVQLYTGNWLSGMEIGKGGVPHKEYGGFCFETQFYPNSCNIPEFPDSILKAGETWTSTTKFCFGLIEKDKEEDGYDEYVTFHVTAKDGSDVEMAVVDEFDFERKHYVVGAVVKDDVIDDEGRYIYRCIVKEDDFEVEKITSPADYEKIAKAYMEME